MAEASIQETPNEKHPGGRPLKFKTVEELDQAINAYFDLCDPHTEQRLVEAGVNDRGETIFNKRAVLTEQKPYTVSGLALALGVTRQTLLNYRDREEYFDSIARAVQRCEAYAESQLYGPFANGAKFNLINNYRGEHQDWTDKQSVDHTSTGKRIESPTVYVSDIASRGNDAPAETEAA